MNISINNLNLNNLWYFYIVVKHQGLGHASKELNLSAPAVTHSLNNLEQSIGQKLCIRNRSEFSLTPTGAHLYRVITKMFQELETFSKDPENSLHFDGILSIGILDHFENDLFHESLKIVIKKFPHIKLNIQSYDSSTINKMLIERELDLGLGIFSHQSPKLKYEKIGLEKLCYFIAKGHPLWSKKSITKADLIEHKISWVDNQNRTRSDLESNVFVENYKFKVQFNGFSNNLSGALHILLSGHSIVPLPEYYGNFIAKKISCS